MLQIVKERDDECERVDFQVDRKALNQKIDTTGDDEETFYIVYANHLLPVKYGESEDAETAYEMVRELSKGIGKAYIDTCTRYGIQRREYYEDGVYKFYECPQ